MNKLHAQYCGNCHTSLRQLQRRVFLTIHSKMSVHGLKEVTLSYSRALFKCIMIFHQEVMRLSFDVEASTVVIRR